MFRFTFNTKAFWTSLRKSFTSVTIKLTSENDFKMVLEGAARTNAFAMAFIHKCIINSHPNKSSKIDLKRVM